MCMCTINTVQIAVEHNSGHKTHSFAPEEWRKTVTQSVDDGKVEEKENRKKDNATIKQ